MVSIGPISSKIQLSVTLKITFIRDVHVWIIAGHIVRTSIYIVQYRSGKHQTGECCYFALSDDIGLVLFSL